MYINFDKIVEKSKREFNKNPNISKYIMDYINIAKIFIENYLKEYEVETGTDLKRKIVKLSDEESKKFIRISSMQEGIFRYEIIKNFIKDPKELERVYENAISKNKEKTNEDRHYTYMPFEERKEKLVEEMVLEVRQLLEKNKNALEICKKYIEGDKNAKEVINQNKRKLNANKREKFEKEIREMLKGELPTIKFYMEDCKQELADRLKNIYIETLCFIGDFLSNLGLKYKYLAMQNRTFRENGFPELEVSNEQFENNDIFSREYLEKIDAEDLPVLTAFWLNRYTKIVSNLNNGIFVINTLNLWDDILIGNTKINLTREELEALYCRMNFLKLANNKIVNSAHEKLNNNTAEIVNNKEDIIEISVEDEFDEIEEIVRVSYADKFAGILPSSYKQIIEDLRMYIPLVSNTSSAYMHKDEILMTQILSYIASKKIKNWGYVDEIGEDVENNDLVVLGIDYEGYNMPLKLHMHKDYLIRGLEEAGLNSEIPIYEGNSDMLVNGRFIKNNFVMFLTEEQKKAIKSLMTSSDKNLSQKKFIEHINFLRDNSKYPNSLMEKAIEKGRPVLRRKPKKYINLKTNERYQKDKSGKILKVINKSEGR